MSHFNFPALAACLALGDPSALSAADASRTEATQTVGATNATAAAAAEESPDAWSFGVSACFYIVPDSREYVQPTLTADRNWLHMEARYNYEELDTGSVWMGYNIALGETLALEFTPMLGGVFGDVTGIAPGYKGSLSWWKLELYSEGEYVVNTEQHSESFFYNWSELSLAPLDWFRLGGVVQRTKLYETDFDVQRGFLVGFSFKNVDFTSYFLNPDANDMTVVLAAGLEF